MNPEYDADVLIGALREDLPTIHDEARLKARLVAGGVLAASLVQSAAAYGLSSASSAASATQVGATEIAATQVAATQVAVTELAVGGGAAASALPATQIGLLAKLASLPAAVKLGTGGAVLALAVSASPAMRHTLSSTSSLNNSATANSATANSVQQNAQDATRDTGVAKPLRPAAVVNGEQTPIGVPSDVKAPTLEPAPEMRAVVTSPPAKPEAEMGTRTRAAHKSVQRPVLTAGETRLIAEVKPPAVVAAPVMPASLLTEETPIIERALRAQHRGDAAEASRALNEHAARFPSGLLSPERERIRQKLQTE